MRAHRSRSDKLFVTEKWSSRKHKPQRYTAPPPHKHTSLCPLLHLLPPSVRPLPFSLSPSLPHSLTHSLTHSPTLPVLLSLSHTLSYSSCVQLGHYQSSDTAVTIVARRLAAAAASGVSRPLPPRLPGAGNSQLDPIEVRLQLRERLGLPPPSITGSETKGLHH